jgi:hypothetical protein
MQSIFAARLDIRRWNFSGEFEAVIGVSHT